jgi:hypothetical protein
MKKAGLVVTKKRFMTKNKDMVAPLSLSPINFSLNYYYTFHSKIPFEVVQVIKSRVTKIRLFKIYNFVETKFLCFGNGWFNVKCLAFLTTHQLSVTNLLTLYVDKV